MKSTQKFGSSNNDGRSFRLLVSLSIFIVLFAVAANATTQLLLSSGQKPEGSEYKGVIELAVNPGFDDARVSITVDGQKIADGLQFPYKVAVDFGPTAVEHKIAVTATAPNKRRVQWVETVNRGHLPLSVKVRPVDVPSGIFEAVITAPDGDPVTAVELWDNGKMISSVDHAPWRITVPPAVVASGFVQVTARTRSGEEAADFWSSAGDVHVESIQVRTVPIFVSVVDRNGVTHEDVDRSLFRIVDGGSDAKIVEFGKAFDQPISIALLLDASSSMTYSMGRATKAALEFAKNTLKKGDRCSVFAIQDVPRRKLELTDNSALVEAALNAMRPAGETALYDAISSALRELKDEKNRRAIVVLTDGDDNASNESYEDVTKAAAQAGIPIYFIAYDTGIDNAARRIDELKNLATDTGGFVAMANEDTLPQRYHEIEMDLRAQFAIRYQVTDYSKPNQWRPIRVLLASPKLTARTIRGYFAP